MGVIKSERSGVIDAIDLSFGVAVFYVQYDDRSEPCEWYAAHELEQQTLRSTPNDWLRTYVGSWLTSRLARSASRSGLRSPCRGEGWNEHFGALADELRDRLLAFPEGRFWIIWDDVDWEKRFWSWRAGNPRLRTVGLQSGFRTLESYSLDARDAGCRKAYEMALLRRAAMYLPNFLDGLDRLVAFDAETMGKRTPDAGFIRKQPFAWRCPASSSRSVSSKCCATARAGVRAIHGAQG